jgi:serine/threonine protein kinase
MGTVFYMAPEQLDGVRDDPRVDMYALAAMLYEMMSGRPYLDFDLASTPSVQAENIRRVHQEAPAPIPEVPPKVSEVILHALEKHPDDRYPDVATLRQQLIRALHPHLPPDKGMSLVAPFRSATESRPGALDNADWPRWIWVALLAMNLIVMIAFAALLLGSL